MLSVLGMVGLVVAPHNETAFGLDAVPMLPNKLPRFEQAASEAALSPGGGPCVGTGAIWSSWVI